MLGMTFVGDGDYISVIPCGERELVLSPDLSDALAACGLGTADETRYAE